MSNPSLKSETQTLKPSSTTTTTSALKSSETQKSLKSSDGSLKSSSSSQATDAGSLKSSDTNQTLKSSSSSPSSSSSLKSSHQQEPSSLKGTAADTSTTTSLKSSSLKSSSLKSSSLKSSGTVLSSYFSTSASSSSSSCSSSSSSASSLPSSLSDLDLTYNLSLLHFDAAVFQQHLQTRLVGRFLSYLPVTTSTQELSKEATLRGAQSGSLFVAEQQTAGKGRVGRVWRSAPLGNLYFTILLHPRSHAALPVLNFAFPLAVCKGMQLHGIREPKIKWPNDVWVGGLKVCGMLLDVSSQGGSLAVHGGVGINVNEDFSSSSTSAEDAENLSADDHASLAALRASATSLRSLLGGTPLSRESLLASICNELEDLVLKYPTIDAIIPTYSAFDLLIGKRVVVMPKKREDTTAYYEAQCIGYSKDGYMRIRTDEGEEKLLVSEEVSVRPEQLKKQ